MKQKHVSFGDVKDKSLNVPLQTMSEGLHSAKEVGFRLISQLIQFFIRFYGNLICRSGFSESFL
jgi:hypothetical protein